MSIRLHRRRRDVLQTFEGRGVSTRFTWQRGKVVVQGSQLKLCVDPIILHLLRKKCPYSKFFWSVFSPNAQKYGPENLRIWTLFAQRRFRLK